MGRLKNAAAAGLVTVVLGGFALALTHEKDTQGVRQVDTFQYQGKTVFLEQKESKYLGPIGNPYIKFENGDIIREGTLTSDDGRKIRVYEPD